MIKSILSLLLFSLVLFSCQKDDNKLVIEGELSNLTTPYFLASSRVSDTIRIDTVYVDEKGKFSYIQHVDTSTIFTFYFNDFNSSTIVFSDKGVNKIKLKGDAKLSDLIEIKGGRINEDLSLFKKENETLLKQRTLLMKKMEFETDSLLNSASFSILEKEETATLNSINHQLAQNVEDFIASKPDRIASVVLINEFFKNNENPETLNRVLGYLEGDALLFPLTYKLKNYNEKLMLSSEGATMPHFKLKVNDDEYIESSDFEDKFLLISFLSSSGDASRENVQILRDTYSSLDTIDINFLSIYIDSESLPIKNILLDSIPWKVIVEEKSWGSDIVDALNINYLPYNILIDSEGKIITRDIPVSDVKNLIDTKTKKSKK